MFAHAHLSTRRPCLSHAHLLYVYDYYQHHGYDSTVFTEVMLKCHKKFGVVCRGVVPLRHLRHVIATVVLIGLYFLKCTRFDQLILRKIIKIVATRAGKGRVGEGEGGGEGEERVKAPPDVMSGYAYVRI